MTERQRVEDNHRRMKPESRQLLKIAGGVAVMAFVIGFGLTALTFLRSGAPIDVVTVPDLREMQVEDATRALDRSDLTIEVGDSFPNPTAPEGAVLAQSPLPGQEVSPGTMVRVILSRGQTRPAVPNVAAMPVPTATQTLQAAGFDVVVEPAPGEGSVGQVVDTQPGSGTNVPLPATVRLRVGAPALPIPMPTLIGMLENDARAMADSVGLNVGEVEYVESDFGEPGGVAAQEPPPGESIRPGSSIQLRVTRSGPRETTGVDTDGLSRDLAGIVGSAADERSP